MIRMKPSLLRGCDLFCGAGGMTTGAHQSGKVQVGVAINHWRTAVFTHEMNHPDVRHICTRIEDMNLTNEHDLGPIDVLMGGIECVMFSPARGGAPINDQRRTTANRVIDWIEKFRPKWCIFENVEAFTKWHPLDENGKKVRLKKGSYGAIFESWVNHIRAHGYHVEWRVLNAAHYGEAQSRKRLIIICRRGGSTEPIRWPKPSHGTPADIQADLAEHHRGNRLYERCAADIIDWQIPCPSIFGRKQPLKDKTLRRIEIGLRKFVAPFVMQYMGNGLGDDAYRAIFHPSRPLPTVMANRINHAFVVPHFNERNGQAPRTHSLGSPSPAVTSRGAGYLVRPYLVQYHGGRDPKRDGSERSYSVDRPLGTLDTSNRYAVVNPFLAYLKGHGTANSLGDPLNTVCAGGGHFGLCTPFAIDTNHGGRDHRTHSMRKPMGTITTKLGRAMAVPYMLDIHNTPRS